MPSGWTTGTPATSGDPSWARSAAGDRRGRGFARQRSGADVPDRRHGSGVRDRWRCGGGVPDDTMVDRGVDPRPADPAAHPGHDQDLGEDLARYELILRGVRPAVLVECGRHTGASAAWFSRLVP